MLCTVWTIYHSPDDYPGKWVLRGFDIDEGPTPVPHEHCLIADTLEAVRAAIPPDALCIRRYPSDDPVVYECWL